MTAKFLLTLSVVLLASQQVFCVRNKFAVAGGDPCSVADARPGLTTNPANNTIMMATAFPLVQVSADINIEQRQYSCITLNSVGAGPVTLSYKNINGTTGTIVGAMTTTDRVSINFPNVSPQPILGTASGVTAMRMDLIDATDSFLVFETCKYNGFLSGYNLYTYIFAKKGVDAKKVDTRCIRNNAKSRYDADAVATGVC